MYRLCHPGLGKAMFGDVCVAAASIRQEGAWVVGGVQ